MSQQQQQQQQSEDELVEIIEDDEAQQKEKDVEEEIKTRAQEERKTPTPKQQQPPRHLLLHWKSRVRTSVAPYLPPPVLEAMNAADAHLQPYVGKDGSITFVSTVLFAWLVLSLARWLSSSRLVVGRKSKAVDDDDDLVLQQQQRGLGGALQDYDATVLLCGPKSSGKTRLLYQLCYNEKDVPTLLSLRANVGIAGSIRYMDWPGHATLSDPLLSPILMTTTRGQQPTRVVVVLDATQPVAPAADTLDQLFSIYYERYNASKSRNKQTPASIFVACHKQDEEKAKNAKRVKIQLRTELERLLQSRSSSTSSSGNNAHGTTATNDNDNSSSFLKPWWPAGEPLELDQLAFCKLYFGSTSCCSTNNTTAQKDDTVADDGLGALVDFCQTGRLPE